MTQIIPFRALVRLFREGSGIDLKQIISGGREQKRQYLMALSTCGRHGYSEPHMRDGIEFWRTHTNASHEFYEGVGPDGRMYHYSVGEDLVGDRGAWEAETMKVNEEFEREFGADIDWSAPGNEAIHLEFFQRYDAIQRKYWDVVQSPIVEMPEFAQDLEVESPQILDPNIQVD